MVSAKKRRRTRSQANLRPTAWLQILGDARMTSRLLMPNEHFALDSVNLQADA